MKIYIPIFITVSLLFSACSINGNTEIIAPENINKPIELEDTFKKKQECIKYKDDMKEDLKKRFTGVFDEAFLREENLTINDIFYSPVKNSCFYEGESLIAGNRNFVIVDFLSNKVIYHSFFSCGLAPENNYITTKQEMQKKCLEETQKRTKQLKGEIPVGNTDLNGPDGAYEDFKRINS